MKDTPGGAHVKSHESVMRVDSFSHPCEDA
jgi:hypothetical protein